MLLAGEPSELAQKVPQAVNLNTWPGTFFIARDGLVRGPRRGSAGKATAARREARARQNARAEQPGTVAG